MSRSLLLAAAALALPLAACDKAGEGTSITVNATDGNAIAAVDGKSGEMKVNLPGFSGAIKLPKVQLDAGNFDLNGVHLYPGSTIETVNVAGGKGEDGGVHVAFTSPADAERVRAWFQERLGKVGFTLHRDGTGLAGTTDENKPFRLSLTPQGDRARGEIVLGS